ncbi:outer membrane biogenesis protein BamB [Gimesia panareensis]|uniref:Outer membrane biogenesis protein BamB n=1 Tax=Gimesia panareensis TaxID=2527978 RepID=A0A517Q6J4_9PLAN|nr:PQQ-binding-like beta-propeller repeat protein [Gimesia panareensis]QDT27257.1 outer membrane biogenesis protein BamB [Gimesia panareensis]
MRSICLCSLVVCLFNLILLESQADAAIFSGEIQSISPDQKQVVIKSIQGKEKSFTIPASVPITFNGKKAPFDQFKTGQRATVFTNSSGEITRFSVREALEPKPQTTVERPKKEMKSRKTTGSSDNKPAGNLGWTQFRGPDRANISSDTGLIKDWNQSPPKLLWTARGLGEGYSSVSLSDNLVFTIGTKANEETVYALDLNTGEIVWSQPNGTIFQNNQGNGPRSTPTIDGNLLYALGANGNLACLSARDGNLEWSKNILQEFAASNIVWGISESPLIDGDKLICTPGGQGATMVALNKRDGSLIWKSAVPGNPKAGYASPIKISVGGIEQYVNFTHSGVMGISAQTGAPLWGNDRAANKTANCSAPVFYPEMNSVFYASGYGTGGALLKLSAAQNQVTAQLGFFTPDMKNHHGGMVQVDGYLYGSSDPGVLTCINLRNGETVWQDRSVGKGALTCADGHIYLRSEKGPVALVEVNPKAYVEKGRFDQPQRSGKPAWPHPVVADGKLFLRDQDLLLCYDVRGQ